MRKRLSAIWKSQRGLTLLELIVTIAIFTILSLSVAMLFGPSIKVYVASTNLSRSNLILDNVMDQISDELMYAVEIKPVDLWPAEGEMDGTKILEYKSPTYGVMRLDQDDEKGIQLKKIKNFGSTDEESQGEIAFDNKLYMGNKVEVAVVKVPAPPDVTVQKTGIVYITAILYDKTGKKVGGQERYVQLLNCTMQDLAAP